MIAIRSKFAIALLTWFVFATSGCAWVQRVSVDSTGTDDPGFNESNGPVLSADGRFIAFDSIAALVPEDTNGSVDVYVRDMRTHTTVRVSVGSAGTQGDFDSYEPAISADGRFVAFYSLASTLVAGDTNGNFDVFVRDTVAGTTSRVSVNSAEVIGNGGSVSSAISADGRYVAFSSDSTNLVGGDTNAKVDVFVRDTTAGTTSRVSVDSAEVQGNGDSFEPTISADGRFVSYQSDATNLVTSDTNSAVDVFVRDATGGTTSRVSVDSAEHQANLVNAELNSIQAALSANGRYVVFTSFATNLVAGDTNQATDIFVRDTVAGTTARVNVGAAGAQSTGDGYRPAISGDGRYVSFASDAVDLVAADNNERADVFVRDTVAGATTIASRRSDGGQTDRDSNESALSADGRYVAFTSLATNLAAGDANGGYDVYVRANPEPLVTGIAPSTLSRGTTTPVTVTGSRFITGALVLINGDGLTVANVTVVSPTQITANVTVAGGATVGTRSVFVELPGTGPGANALAIGACVGCLTLS